MRDAGKLEARSWFSSPRVEVVEGDVGDPDALSEAMQGVGVAYYLVHSMIATGDAYQEEDRRLALLFSRTADASGVGRSSLGEET